MTAGLPQSQETTGSLYIINLCASATPMALETPDVPELSGYAVFRSRRLEDGRDRFRLHLGYFDSQEQAEALLPLLRDRHPAAWVSSAPKEAMGSLDDTSVAQFKLIRQKKSAGTANQTSPGQQPGRQPATAALMKTIPAEQFFKPQEFLQPQEVLNLLETGSPSCETPGIDASSPVHRVQPDLQPAKTREAAPAVQKFAVQLVWSAQRPDLSKLPRPVVFNAYSLYTVTVQRGPEKWYGLRLGFFTDPASARQLALYVRSDFKMVSVVPVSERECARAADSVKAANAKEEARRAAKATASKSAAKPAPAPQPKAPAKPTNDLIAAKDNIKQVLEELGKDSFDSANDSGVRHLSVAVVKPKNPMGDKLLQNRWSRLR